MEFVHMGVIQVETMGTRDSLGLQKLETAM